VRTSRVAAGGIDAQPDSLRESVTPQHFIFILRGLSIPEARASFTARQVLAARLAAGMWPLGRRTPYQDRLQPGDRVLFYAAGDGPDRTCVIGHATISGAKYLLRSSTGQSPFWLGAVGPTARVVPIRDGVILDNPISLKERLSELVFIRNKAEWGSYLQGGIVKIPIEDFQSLLLPREPGDQAGE
jgi:hypothetical protein